MQTHRCGSIGVQRPRCGAGPGRLGEHPNTPSMMNAAIAEPGRELPHRCITTGMPIPTVARTHSGARVLRARWHWTSGTLSQYVIDAWGLLAVERLAVAK